MQNIKSIVKSIKKSMCNMFEMLYILQCCFLPITVFGQLFKAGIIGCKITIKKQRKYK